MKDLIDGPKWLQIEEDWPNIPIGDAKEPVILSVVNQDVNPVNPNLLGLLD